MNKFLRSIQNEIVIIVFAFICFHFLWYDPYSMKWDMSEQYLPWRYFIGKCLQNQTLPFWNPFQNGGYPTFADPQSAIWYYPSWLIGSIVGYKMNIVELEVLGFIILSGLGFYRLATKIGYTKKSSLLVSSAYMCSGFIVGNAQHMTWIAAAAWIPWLFYYYLSIRKEIINYYLAWFLIILYLYLSSSYPAFIIVTTYIIFIDQLVLFIRSNQKINFITRRIIFTLLCIIISIPILYSIFISKDYFSRGDGITLFKALQHPFSWQSMLSFVAPFSSFKNTALFNTDISMSNAYVGIFTILLFTTSLFWTKTKRSLLWLGLLILFLIIGFGEQTPLRAWLYHYLPGFNLFRFPALFRLFSIIFLLLYIAEQFDYFIHNFDTYKQKFRFVIIIFLLVFTGILVFNIQSWHPFQVLSLTTLEKSFNNTNFYQHLTFQLSIQCIIIVLIVLLRTKKLFNQYILIIFLLDLFISVRLNAMATMVVGTKSKQIDEVITKAPKKIIIPIIQKLNSVTDQRYEYRWPLNWNMNCYFGEIAIDGYNPFVLKTFNSLSDSKLRDSIWENAWFYTPNSIVYSDTPQALNSRMAWQLNPKKHDTLFLQAASNIQVKEFKPNKIVLDYTSDSTSALVLAQNPFPGWSASIDQNPVEITIVNFSQQLIHLKEGRHTVIWKFENQILNYILYIHMFLFVALLGFASLKSFQSSRKN